MFNTLPTDARPALDWTWDQFAPFFEDLQNRELQPATGAEWLSDWSRLHDLFEEVFARLYLIHDQDTANPAAEERLFSFMDNVVPPAESAEQRLKDKLLRSQPDLDNMAVPLRRIQAEADLFREENIPLSVQLDKLGAQYTKIVGNQTAMWDGQELPLPQLKPYLNDPDRSVRERAWKLAQERRLEDRSALNALWQEMLPLRREVAANADCADFREFMWRQYHRFDYTPADGQAFHEAIAQVCVPAATRIYERHRQRLGLDTLRPWDLNDGEYGRPVDPPGRKNLQPYADAADFLQKSVALFQQVDHDLGAQFQQMVSEELLDVENRTGKAPGGYCTYFSTAKRPFIFMNAVGLHDDVQTMMHEAGHAFHAFAHADLPYYQQRFVPMEFNEVASMAMELLASPYLAGNGTASAPPFYTPADAARARIEHLESTILFWPYMAVVDAFQHWVYTHVDQAGDPDNCDAQWSALWARYLPAVNWQGLGDIRVTGWQRKVHIYQVPFYYIEYGLAAMGAVQVWRNALDSQNAALAQYREALALGGTQPLPTLYSAAGAKFAFDALTLQSVVSLIEAKIEELEETVSAN